MDMLEGEDLLVGHVSLATLLTHCHVRGTVPSPGLATRLETSAFLAFQLHLFSIFFKAKMGRVVTVNQTCTHDRMNSVSP